MMSVLMDVRAVMLRATYDNYQTYSSVREISVEVADGRRQSGVPASMVERCDCPNGYTGMYNANIGLQTHGL